MVIVYSSPSCTQCAAAKDTLKIENISYNEIDITTNNEARNKLIESGYMSLPVFEVDGELVSNVEDVLNSI